MPRRLRRRGIRSFSSDQSIKNQSQSADVSAMSVPPKSIRDATCGQQERSPLVRLMRLGGRLGERSEGLTLIEMLVALGIISTAVFALLAGFITSAASIQSQQQHSRAVRVALDQNESLRLESYNSPELEVGTRTGTSTAPGGLTFDYTTTVVERDAYPDEDVPGDKVKDVTTEVRWSMRGKGRSVTYTTAVAKDPRDIGLPAGYVQAIKSMSVAPDPSASVDYNGYAQQPITVTVVMTGHSTDDVVRISWTDERGARSGIATTTDARYWRLTLPAGSGGIQKHLAQSEKWDLRFTATTDTGLTAQSTLAVWGPVDNPPLITSFTVNPSPVTMFNNGKNRYQNQSDVTITCVVDRLDVSANSRDSVKVTYPGETGPIVEDILSRTGVTGSQATYSKTYARSTTYFGMGADQPYTCIVNRFSDGGPASKTIKVQVGR